jgi:signal transduction histidine kinase
MGAIAAYVFQAELRTGNLALLIVGVSATLNFAAYFFQGHSSMARLCMVASPIIGVGGWTAVITITGGVSSPFIAGLWLEVVLSAMALRPRGIVLVTLGSTTALGLQQLRVGLEGALLALGLQLGFLVAMGLATYLVTRRWTQRQTQMDEEREELDDRLDALNRRLEDERTVAALGENVARLAHGLKNTVHSLRGFVSLIEPKLREKTGSSAALQGLRNAIDELEALARLTLDPDGVPAAQGRAQATAGEGGGLALAIERAVAEIATSHPGVRWDVKLERQQPPLPLPESSFVETLVILLRNSVEAMQGQGSGSLEVRTIDDELRVSICDEGPGFDPEQISQIFKPGYTTKPQGSGYGLFLARRIVAEHEGWIEARPRPGNGAIVELGIPIAASRETEAARR